MEKVSSIKSSTSIAIFLLSIAWFRRKRNKFETEEFDEYRNNISARGVAALKKGSPYWESFLRVLQVSRLQTCTLSFIFRPQSNFIAWRVRIRVILNQTLVRPAPALIEI